VQWQRAASAVAPPSGVMNSRRFPRRTRIKFFKTHADSGRLVFPTHFPTPTGGTIARDGADYHFVFDGEDRSAIRA
jgi:hypothetical protein